MLAVIMLNTTPMREHDLLEERDVDRAEPLERGELDDPLDLAFEEDRQHEDVARRAPRRRELFTTT